MNRSITKKIMDLVDSNKILNSTIAFSGRVQLFVDWIALLQHCLEYDWLPGLHYHTSFSFISRWSLGPKTTEFILWYPNPSTYFSLLHIYFHIFLFFWFQMILQIYHIRSCKGRHPKEVQGPKFHYMQWSVYQFVNEWTNYCGLNWIGMQGFWHWFLEN